MTQRLLILPALLLLCARSNAQVMLTLPLEGYFRVGRYMPVEMSGNSPIEIRGRGILTTRIVATPNASAVVPVLVLDGDVDSGSFSTPLRRLGENERLVGLIGNSTQHSFAQELFPDRDVISINLDPAMIKGPATAWEALDAIVVDRAWPGQLGQDFVSTLLGGGATFAFLSPNPPGMKLPWSRHGEGWLLRYSPVGPTSSIVPTAYAPVLAWKPGMSFATRLSAVLFGVMVSIVSLGATLLPRRAVMLVLTSVVVVSGVALRLWIRGHADVHSVGGAVVLRDDRLIQADEWTYQTAARDTDVTWQVRGDSRPILVSSEHADGIQLVMECSGDGAVRGFTARLGPGRTIAFLNRRLYREDRSWTIAARTTSPLHALVRDAYGASNLRVAGEEPLDPPAQRWPSVFVERLTPR